ncbi:hypothetical protein L829_4008 [Mycobacteroides abscessus MAB_030201_1075]|uniref:Uncharacterized protein n=1 Tax=Mycobacteroides abscessus MAB_030201_1075 TaxID=1335410 RepID=A0A829PT46_9MYCO|nr:hypothetical protein L829_4008 [Mycobacteroides abscessus MAB_030201_1075]CPU47043.1 Uncharacterised protein [Mycobacteroides abscessus]SIL72990.1 Uncharacterised protein [Mycobacteroides abscessus subsp. abscessus]
MAWLQAVPTGPVIAAALEPAAMNESPIATSCAPAAGSADAIGGTAAVAATTAARPIIVESVLSARMYSLFYPPAGRWPRSMVLNGISPFAHVDVTGSGES